MNRSTIQTLYIAVLIATCYAVANAQTPTPTVPSWAGATYDTAFSDEFTATDAQGSPVGIDRHKWITTFPGGVVDRSKQGEQGTYDPNDPKVLPWATGTTDGYTALTAYRTPTGYMTGVLCSYPHAVGYGLLEVRAVTAPGIGMWNAIWLRNASGPEYEEVDTEIYGWSITTAVETIHAVDLASQWLSFTNPKPPTISDTSRNWHVYGYDFEQDSVTYYVDGRLKWVYYGAYVPSEPLYLIINPAVKSGKAGPTTVTAFPATMKVDYVRWWTRP